MSADGQWCGGNTFPRVGLYPYVSTPAYLRRAGRIQVLDSGEMVMLKAITIIMTLAVPSFVAAAGFPTVETVRMVVSCMAALGDQTEENLLTCACRQDVLETELAFEVFEEASLQERYSGMPGKRGGLFRDDETSREYLKQLKAARKNATTGCPEVRKVMRAEEGNSK